MDFNMQIAYEELSLFAQDVDTGNSYLNQSHSLEGLGAQILTHIWNGIKSLLAKIWEALKALFAKLLRTFQSYEKILRSLRQRVGERQGYTPDTEFYESSGILSRIRPLDYDGRSYSDMLPGLAALIDTNQSVLHVHAPELVGLARELVGITSREQTMDGLCLSVTEAIDKRDFFLKPLEPKVFKSRQVGAADYGIAVVVRGASKGTSRSYDEGKNVFSGPSLPGGYYVTLAIAGRTPFPDRSLSPNERFDGFAGARLDLRRQEVKPGKVSLPTSNEMNLTLDLLSELVDSFARYGKSSTFKELERLRKELESATDKVATKADATEEANAVGLKVVELNKALANWVSKPFTDLVKVSSGVFNAYVTLIDWTLRLE